jgi:hypothetical protein
MILMSEYKKRNPAKLTGFSLQKLEVNITYQAIGFR